MADNEISDASPLAALPHLHTLNLRNNKLTSVLRKYCPPPPLPISTHHLHLLPPWLPAFEPDALVDNFADAEFQVSVGSALDEADLSGNQIEIMNDISQHRFLTRLFLNNNAISRIAVPIIAFVCVVCFEGLVALTFTIARLVTTRVLPT